MTGLQSALSGLQRIESRLRANIRKENDQAAQHALKTAQILVPVRTGALRNSLQAQSAPLGMEISAHRPYALYLEYGTKRMSARPYLLPAAREADYPARMLRAMQEAIL